MSIFGTLPAWAVGLLALGAGALLLFFNYGWLLAVKSMLAGQRRKGGSKTDAIAGDRADPTGGSAP
jgi:hypothetical protein